MAQQDEGSFGYLQGSENRALLLFILALAVGFTLYAAWRMLSANGLLP